MKISKVQFVNEYESIALPFQAVNTYEPFICTQIDGLGPPEAGARISRSLQLGSVYSGRLPENREIVARIGLNPTLSSGQSASDLRSRWYKYLISGDELSDSPMTFEIYDENDNLWAFTKGYIQRIEIVPFSKDPEIQITMGCLSPYFEKTLDTQIPTGTTANPVIINNGSVSTGFEMSIYIGAMLSTGLFTITNLDYPEFLSFSASEFASGDRLVINTNPGIRSLRLYKGGTTPVINLLKYLTPDSKFLKIRPGVNHFQINKTTYSWIYLKHVPLEWGI